MFEHKSFKLPDLEETQIWDSPNVTVSIEILETFRRVFCFRKPRINEKEEEKKKVERKWKKSTT